MNLHVVPDSAFSNKFYSNLVELKLTDTNRVIVRSNKKSLKYIRHKLPLAPLYSTQFSSIAGDTRQYKKVFIHQFSPLMYRWVAQNEFQELSWIVWGTDLYNLPGLSGDFYEPLTKSRWLKKHFSLDTLLFKLKVLGTNSYFKRRAYSKVDNVLTWMQSEYQFAIRNIPSLKAKHQFFFYENEVPYQKLDQLLNAEIKPKENLTFILGNSGTPTNNHLDAVRTIIESGVHADIVVPVSYGDRNYIKFLRKNLTFYKQGKVEFIDRFMPFEGYVGFLNQADALIMNNIRPQGYGNIFMMLYLGKPVFLNKRNISLSDLVENGINCTTLTPSNLAADQQSKCDKNTVSQFLSHEKLIDTYTGLFS